MDYEADMVRLFGLDILDPYLYAVAALEEWSARQDDGADDYGPEGLNGRFA
jgi:hypothetical protein